MNRKQAKNMDQLILRNMIPVPSTQRAIGKSIIHNNQKMNASNRKSQNIRQQKTQDKKSAYPLIINQTQPDLTDQNPVYGNIKTVAKVTRFIQNIKTLVVLNKQKLEPKQAEYLQRDTLGQGRSPYLFSWDNNIIFAFEITLVFVALFECWICSFQIVLGEVQLDKSFDISFIGFYVILIALTFNTQVKTDSFEVLQSRTQIAIHRLKKETILDLIAILCLSSHIIEIQPLFYPSRLIFLIFIIPKISKILKKFEEFFAISPTAETIFAILRLVSRVLMFLHGLSLVLNLLSQIQKSYGIQQTWIQHNGLQNSSKFELYVEGYYFSSTTMSTVGFGDFTPANVIQRGFMCFVQIFCCLFFGYCLNIIGNLIGLLGQAEQNYKKNYRRLNRCLKTMNIQNQLKQRVRQHFHNKHQIEKVYDAESQKYFFQKMNEQLINQIKKSSNMKIVQKNRLLKSFSQQSKSKLSRVLKKRVYAPDQVLFNADTSQQKLYLIEQGQVNEFCFDSAKSKKSIANYDKEDNVVGWSNFITGNTYKSCARSVGYTLIQQISRDQFIQILGEYRKDLIRFHQIREKIIQVPVKFKSYCIICDKLTHNVITCPRIHLIPKPFYFLIGKHKKQQKLLINLRKASYFRKKNRKSDLVCNKKVNLFQSSDLVNQSSNRKLQTDSKQNRLLQSHTTKLDIDNFDIEQDRCMIKDKDISLQIAQNVQQVICNKNSRHKTVYNQIQVHDGLDLENKLQASQKPDRKKVNKILTFQKKQDEMGLGTLDQQQHDKDSKLILYISNKDINIEKLMIQRQTAFFPAFNINCLDVIRKHNQKCQLQQLKLKSEKKKICFDNRRNCKIISNPKLTFLKNKKHKEF